MMSRALSGLGLIAVLSPPVGGLMVEAFGWRATLLLLAVFGAVTLLHVALRLPETVPQRDPDATRPARVLRNWAEVVRPSDLSRLGAARRLHLRRPVLPARQLVVRLHPHARRRPGASTA